ncbi:MAG TPA: FAD-binding oxidoreductase [Solirubrobacteraceae bacterium]|jgi:glycolate oxidase FAD binding subunit|nr:FAD-binding oxidoreductase [Solirubrobacteraceae bacterium]
MATPSGSGGALAPPTVSPATPAEVAEQLAGGGRVRPVGGGTKLAWGAPGIAPDRELSTAGLDRIVAHNDGDLTAVLEAGVPIARAQAAFALHGQRLTLDPPDGGGAATIGGILATGDSGPLRHRFGGPRDLILGVRIALPDGTVARAGSDVIKNVAGYDLAKLMCGGLGTLGVICEATVRLHPVAEATITVQAHAHDPGSLCAAARRLARHPLELESLDLRWDGPEDGGLLLARAVGRTVERSVRSLRDVLAAAGLESDQIEDDDELWAQQRDRQRAAPGGAVVRVSGLPADLERILRAAPSAVGRPALGLVWVRLQPDPGALAELRRAVHPAACVLLDAPEQLRAEVDVWGVGPGTELDLLRRVKQSFDPAGVCNAGRYAGGI